MSRKKLPVVRDEEMESLSGVSIESASAFYDDDSGNLVVIGELAARNGVLEDEYREVHVVVFDVEGEVVGRDFSNWGSFGLRRSFELSFEESEDLYGTPSSVRVFPASPFAATASDTDSEFTEPSGTPNCGQEPHFALGPATVDHERLANTAEDSISTGRRVGAEPLCTEVSLCFYSDDLDEVVRLLGVQPSRLSQFERGLLLHGDVRPDIHLTGQIAALLSRTTDDLDAWRELVEEHLAHVFVAITASRLDSIDLDSEIMLAMAERSLGFNGWTCRDAADVSALRGPTRP